jgi:alpha-L-fucosidase
MNEISKSLRRRRDAFAACLVLAVCLAFPASAGRDARMDWWREARFGMFIHWGIYAVPAGEWQGRTDYGEWIRNNAKIPIDVYDQFRTRFNPAAFDADAWVRMARGAGMRYVVITTKHHDGFGLFDSKQGDFNVMATPLRRDIVKELVQACRRQGVRIGFYYSIMDWHHADYLPRRDWEKDRSAAGADFERYVVYMKAQLKELLTSYGPIDILWFDGQWESTWTASHGRDLYAYVRSLQPNIIINNRVGGKSGDFGTPEQEIPATGVPGLDWETCMTMNHNWGFNLADKDFKPASVLVRNLVDIASKGGNFLLNVGPGADGRFPVESVDRLAAIGQWTSRYGASIYGTQASPFASLPWGRCTRRSMPGNVTRLYLHVFDWPADGQLVVDGLLNQPRRAFVLGDADEHPLSVDRRHDGLRVRLSVAAPQAIDPVIVVDIDGQPNVATPPVIAGDDPTLARAGAVDRVRRRAPSG